MLLYKLIAAHPNPKDIYLGQLQAEGFLSKEDAKKFEDSYNEYLESEFEISRQSDKALVYDFLSQTWEGYRHGKLVDFEASPETGVDKKKLVELGTKLATLPDGKKYFGEFVSLSVSFRGLFFRNVSKKIPLD